MVGGWWWVAGLRGLGVQLTSAEKAEHLFLNLILYQSHFIKPRSGWFSKAAYQNDVGFRMASVRLSV